MKQQRITHGALAMHLGINVRHVRRLIRHGMPTTSVAEARRWRSENIAGNGDDTTGGLNEERAALIVARRRLCEIEIAERQRTLIPAGEVEAWFASIGQALRSQFLQVSQTVRTRHPGIDAAVVATLDELHHEALQTLADGQKALVEGRAAE